MSEQKKLIPTEQKNEYEILSLKAVFLIFFFALYLVTQVVLRIYFGPNEILASDLTPQNISEAINKERALRNLGILNTDSRLGSAAEYKAQDMISRNYFSHTDPEGNYIWPKIVEFGYTPYLQLGENLAIEFYNTESLVAAWMNSPTHRANVLQEGFKDQGMGVNFGNAGAGQYHSAIANTFGALLVKKVQSPAPAPAPKKAPAPKPSPAPTVSDPKPVSATPPATQAPPATTTAPVPKPAPDTITEPTSSPAAATSSTAEAPKNSYGPKALAIRGSNEPGFTTAAQRPEATTTLPALPKSPAGQTQALVGQTQDSFNYYKTNRYLSLIFGGVILLFLLSDTKAILQKKLRFLDKKVNDLFVLLLAMMVVALLYWF